MKAFVVSIVLHLVILLVIFLNGGFEPVETKEIQEVAREQAAHSEPPSPKTLEIKDSKKRTLNNQEKKDLIVEKLKAQEKQASRMTPIQKHRALDSQLSQLEGVDGGILELMTLEVLKLMDADPEPKAEVQVATGKVSKQTFNHSSSFFSDVVRCEPGIRVSMEDKFGNKMSYIIEKKDITEDDMALLKLYEKSKSNKHLKVILDAFIQHYQAK